MDEIPKDVEARCKACNDARGCPNVKVCCGGKITVNIIVPCPKNYWQKTKRCTLLHPNRSDPQARQQDIEHPAVGFTP